MSNETTTEANPKPRKRLTFRAEKLDYRNVGMKLLWDETWLAFTLYAGTRILSWEYDKRRWIA